MQKSEVLFILGQGLLQVFEIPADLIGCILPSPAWMSTTYRARILVQYLPLQIGNVLPVNMLYYSLKISFCEHSSQGIFLPEYS